MGKLADAGMELSNSSVGDRFVNALAETITGAFKIQIINRLALWGFKDLVEWETLQCVDWFN